MRRTCSLSDVRFLRLALVMAGAMVAASALSGVGLATAASGHTYPITTISVRMPHAYKPVAAPRTTDDYHCTLVNPHVKRDSYVISSQFFPGSPEDHHALLYVVPPSLAASAERAAYTDTSPRIGQSLYITSTLGSAAPRACSVGANFLQYGQL